MGVSSAPRAVEVGSTNPAVKDISRNVFSYVTYSWMTPLLKLGSQRPLETEDLPNVPRTSQAAYLAPFLDPFFLRLQEHVRNPTTATKPSFIVAISRPYWSRSALSFALKLVGVASSLLMPYLISDVISVLSTPADGQPKDTWFDSIYAYAAVYFVLSLFGAAAAFVERAICMDIFVQSRAILIGAVYGKSLRLSPAARVTFKAGTINSLVDVDANAAADINENFNGFASALAQIAVALWLLARALGVTTWVATGAWLFLAILIGVLMPFLGKFRKGYLAALDERTRILREFLYGISGLKLEGSVRTFLVRIRKARTQQLAALAGLTFVMSCIFSFVITQMTALSTVAIVAYDKLGGHINAENVFPILGYLGALSTPTGSLLHFLGQTIQVFPSIARLTAFLYAEEITHDQVTDIVPNKDRDAPAVKLDGACFSFSQVAEKDEEDSKKDGKKDGDKKPAGTAEKLTKDLTSEKTAVDADRETLAEKEPAHGPFKLSDLNLSIPRGCLAVVVGSVGSGKSAFLSALAGSMRKTSGTAVVQGSVALCLQSPWILSGTVQDNICGLFSTTGGPKQALAAAKSACLEQDLKVLGGLDAIVGEKGVQLSGGQRARIALARAIASDSSVLLLDDPFAALDAKVGKFIFEDTLCRELKNRTRILVTHQLQFAARADVVIVLDAGRIVETGAFRTLLADPDSRLSFLMKSYRIDDLDADADASILPSTVDAIVALDDNATMLVESKEDKLQEARKAVKEFQAKKSVAEDRRVGRVASTTYKSFFSSSSPFLLILVIVGWIVATSLSSWQSILLVQWSVESGGWTDAQYFGIFWAAGLVRTVAYVVLIIAYFYATYTAARNFHDKALEGLAYAPISWYDDQPIGRIMNRMTADVKELDLEFSMVTLNLLVVLSLLTTSLINLAYATPYMLIAFAVLTFPAIYIFKYYQSSYRELKRLSSILRSPLSAHVSESLNGISTIKAYNGTARFIKRQQETTDLASKSSLLRSSAELWLGLRLAVLTSIIILASLLLAAAKVLSRSAVGLSLVSSMMLTDLLITVLSNASAAEAAFNAVERLDHYAKDLPSESKQIDAPNTPKDWPRSGSITFENLQLGYSAVAKPVVENLSLAVASGEHLGVVGRTGAGKSTLMLSLFRIVEPQVGRILIDGIDISTLSLQTLRTGLTIIPQEPVLFGGSFRYNLDMKSMHTDAEIWTALALTGMKAHISNLPDKLESIVADSGSDLSAGQRQLICLAKAVLARPRILVLDEAASAVDSAADQLLLSAILTEFKETTVISIAHRLGSVAGFDRVAVLDAGRLEELGTPADLLEMADGRFRGMVDATGVANAALIASIAGQKRDAERVVG